MKKKLFLLLITFIFIGCNNDNDSKPKDTSLAGTWKLAEFFGGDGGSNPKWSPVSNGYTYTFKSDGTFTSTRFSECTYGTYNLENSKLTLIFGCTGFTTSVETPKGTFVENYRINNGKMILTPSYSACIEGCDYAFVKIK